MYACDIKSTEHMLHRRKDRDEQLASVLVVVTKYLAKIKQQTNVSKHLKMLMSQLKTIYYISSST